MRSCCFHGKKFFSSCSPLRPQDILVIPFSSPPKKSFRSFLHTSQLTHPDPISAVTPDVCLELLSSCNLKSLKLGICVHSPIVKLGLDAHLLLANNLLSLYGKCYGPDQARKLFDEMPLRDVVSWTGIISAYVRGRSDDEALELFQDMLISGLIPNQFTLATVLRCVSSLRASDSGTCIHAHIIKRGFESNPVLSAALTDFYSKCGKLQEARRIFSLAETESKDLVSWTTIISASLQAEDWRGAMQLYFSMVASGVSPNEFTFAKLLTASSFLGLHCGKSVHAHLILWGVKLNLVLKTALVDMYCKCHKMTDALKVLHQTPESDVMLWTAMVSGYTRVGDYEEAISTFQAMEAAGIRPNSFTYAAVLSACTAFWVQVLGEQAHSRVVKSGLDHNLSAGNALVDMYAKLSQNPDDAVQAFEAIISPNVVSWTALIAGLARHELAGAALAAFAEMRAAGVAPNSFTISTILKCCGSSEEALAHARKLHGYVVKTNLGATDITVGNSLVDLYARVGEAADAKNISAAMPTRDALTYTSLAKGLNQKGFHREALDVLPRMLLAGDARMDGFSLATFLSASARLVAEGPGKQLHCYSVKSGLGRWTSVSNGLVDMYGKCGNVAEARRAFAAIREPNVVSWNGLISGLASNGRFAEALSAFEDMMLAGAEPDGVTVLVVLYACSHGGLVDLGVEYFNSMRERWGVRPQPEHYVCLVDMLGRAGRLGEAASELDSMPFRPDALLYKTLLSGCRLHGNLAMGEWAARQAMEMDPSDPAVYVMLAGMYDDAGKTEWGEQTRRLMREGGVAKYPGQSWVEPTTKHLAHC